MFSPLSVDSTDVVVLRHWAAEPDAGPALSVRARIVLLSGEGWGPSAIARELACSKQTVITWRERYRFSGVAGLADGPRSGRPPKLDETVVIARTLESPGAGARWSTRSLGADLGLSNVAVANIWRRWGVKPLTGGRVLLTTTPVLDVPVTALAGMYVDPPLHVLAVVTGEPQVGSRSAATAPDMAWTAGLARIDPRPGTGDPAPLLDFGRRIKRGAGPGSARTRLVVAGDATAVLAAIPAGDATLHVVAGVPSWRRAVHLCCLMAGAHPTGVVSVDSVRAALSLHDPACRFDWTMKSV